MSFNFRGLKFKILKKLLIVEDEENLANGLRFNLELEGFEVTVAPDGKTAYTYLENAENEFAAVVLDVMLPDTEGFQIARRMRENGDFTPILMLTARSSPEDVLQGFESGTDDYLPKPFELEIFLARLRGLLRRREWFALARQEKPSFESISVGDKFTVNGRTIDFKNLELITATEKIQLTLMEVKLLRYLIENAGEAVSRKTILENVWQLSEDTDTRAIDNFIVRLRRYIETEPNNPQFLLTVRGVGYRFVN